MGLSRNIAPSGSSLGPLFVEAQVNAVNFAAPLFAFKMDNINGTSWMDFGQVRSSSVNNINDITYLDMYDNFFWLQLVTGIGFGNTGDDDSYGFETEYSVIFDTAASYTYVPQSLWDDFFKYFKNAAPDAYIEESGIGYFTYCDITVYPTLYFLIDGYWTEMKPNDYIIDSSGNQDRSVCTIGIVPNSEDYWLFGDSFLRGYYSVFNMQTGKLGLGPHTDSDK